jgi:predicted thioredoxin/glutaredoxin
MKTATEMTSIPANVMADAQAVADALAAKRPVDPEVAQRVRERGAKITEELRQKYGERNIAVDLIREIRDEP